MKSNYLRIFLCWTFIWSVASSDCLAHEIRPAYLEINEVGVNQYAITFKVPVLNDRLPRIVPIFAVDYDSTTVSIQRNVDARISKWLLHTDKSISGTSLSIQNLERTLIDVILRIEFNSGEVSTLVIQPSKPSVIIPVQQSSWQVFNTFGKLGIEHILLGWDHLLFVLGLMLLIPSVNVLIGTITSFTIAHSITLVLSSLGKMSLPSAPVETVIALSVIFLAREYIMLSRGQQSITTRYPWTIAFVFGLLHGFGFAGALRDIGLPEHALPESLLSFNLGVEFGQILFVCLIIFVYKLLLPLFRKIPSFWLRYLPGYFIGGIASYWFIDRLMGIFI